MRLREPRRKILVPARMCVKGAWHDACLLNVSSRGLLVHAASAPVRGCVLEIRCGPHIVVARVVWAKGHRFGVRTTDVVPVGAFTDPKLAARSPKLRGTERRATPRPQAWAAEHNRLRGRTFEFVCLVVAATAASFTAATAVDEMLGQPLAGVSAALAR